MINSLLLYVGSASIIIWGVSHIIPTRSVANGFGVISEDNPENRDEGVGSGGLRDYLKM